MLNYEFYFPKKNRKHRLQLLTTWFSVSVPTINVETYPPMDDKVFAKPKMVPEKFGAMSKPLPR